MRSFYFAKRSLDCSSTLSRWAMNMNTRSNISISSITISSSKSCELITPTDEDATELFHRMNSRPGSIITKDNNSEQLAKYNQDWTKQYTGQSPIVVRPESTEEVSSVLQYCHKRYIGVVPQAGNTGLVGGSVGALGSKNKEIILSVEKMNRIHHLDPNSGILQAQAGCVLQTLQDYAAAKNHLVPVDLGSKGTCQIGGNISTNAGGSYYYRYGSLHANTVGLQVVLPDGTILNLGYDPCHLKDNTGYDLKHLFIGAEGTLGVITNVALLCPPLPRSKCAAFLACETYEQVYHTLAMAKSHLGEALAAFEFMDDTVLELVMDGMRRNGNNHNSSFPLSSIPKYSILVETHGCSKEGEHDHQKQQLQEFVETAFVHGLVKDGAVAQNLGQVQDFWKIRESCNPSVASQGYVYKYDVSLSVVQFEEFIEEIKNGLSSFNTSGSGSSTSWIENAAVCANWGHVIDGNLHLNVVVPGRRDKDDELYHRMEDLVLGGILSRGGSISAEHGLGQYKNKHMAKIKDEATLQTMRRVKALFDPHGIMNPGKYLPP